MWPRCFHDVAMKSAAVARRLVPARGREALAEVLLQGWPQPSHPVGPDMGMALLALYALRTQRPLPASLGTGDLALVDSGPAS